MPILVHISFLDLYMENIEGILFTDKLSSLKKRLIKKKLDNISKGKIRADYRMRFPKLKKGK